MGTEPETSKGIMFYSIHDAKKVDSFKKSESFSKIDIDKELIQILLVRDNNWNDYSVVSSFDAYYFEKKDNNWTFLGSVKIIKNPEEDMWDEKGLCCTVLPENFESLDKKTYFSRGTISFYSKIKSLLGKKKEILSSLNDVEYNNISQIDVSAINPSLAHHYQSSLYRDFNESLTTSSEYAANSLEIINNIHDAVLFLMKSEESGGKDIMIRLLYGSVISALEAYLGDAFKYNVINSQEHLENFIKKYLSKIKGEKIEWKDLMSEKGSINDFVKKRVKETMDDMIFHKVKEVYDLYKEVLGIELPQSLFSFIQPIQNRHVIFHGGKKTRAGEDLVISIHDVLTLTKDVREFIGGAEKVILPRLD